MNAQAFSLFSNDQGPVWILSYDVGDTEKVWPHAFRTENAALLFAAMNRHLLK